MILIYRPSGENGQYKDDPHPGQDKRSNPEMGQYNWRGDDGQYR